MVHCIEPSNKGTGYDVAASNSSEHEEPNESTPFLAEHRRGRQQQRRRWAGRSSSDSILRSAAGIDLPKIHNPDLIVAVFCAIVLVGSGANGLWMIPATRKVEDIVCRHYYDVKYTQDTIDEGLCKEDAIQSEVAYIFAVYSSLQAFIGALSAIPWGIVADRFGRKRVYSFAVFGMAVDLLWFAVVCAFPQILPIQALWFGPMLWVLGGGNSALSAITLSMLADTTSSNNRLVEANSFMRMHLSAMVGNLCAPALAGWMMGKTGPWPVMCLAYGLFLTLMFTIHLVPETQPSVKEALDPTSNEAEVEAPVVGAIQHTLHRLRESLGLLRSRSLIALLVTLLSSYPVILSTMQFMSIFASKRFHISLSQTGYLSSWYGLCMIVTIIIFLPALSKLLASPTLPEAVRFADGHERDLFLARMSSIAVLVGSLTMAVAPSVEMFVGGLAILSLGTGGWSSYVKSVSAVFVDATHRTKLYSIVSVVETAGQTYTQPMLAGLFSLGMRLGGFWIGLPYLGVAGFCATALVLLLVVRLPPNDRMPKFGDDDNGETNASA